jgi:hypothetical protein
MKENIYAPLIIKSKTLLEIWLDERFMKMKGYSFIGFR